MTALEFAAAAFTVYAVTGLVTVSHIFKPFRRWFRRTVWRLPFGIARHIVKYENRIEGMVVILDDDEDLDLTTERDIEGYSAINCSQCVGVWVTAALWLAGWPLVIPLGVCGAAYFVVTQERG